MDENEYVVQLKDVFDSCDKSGTGQLNKNELRELCLKLQLDDQIDALITQLLGEEQQGRVGFDAFKEGFVSVLSNAVDELDVSSDEEGGSGRGSRGILDFDDTVSPKYVRDGKKYGRRSKPEFEESDTDLSYQSPRHTPRVRQGTRRERERLSSIDSVESLSSPTDAKLAKTESVSPAKSDLSDSKAEMFEAEGQMNQSMADIENYLDPVSEEEHLKSIWLELGVGRNGYLSMHELSTVCEHIGMEEMNEEEVSQLFDKLDVDQDGQVSFQEFLQGLFQHGSSTVPSTPIRPPSSQKQKLKLSMHMSMDLDGRVQTPSIVGIGNSSGVFTTLDPNNTGYAKTDDIKEFWDTLGIKNSSGILQHLNCDTSGKVNLAELSYALEQELLEVEHDNAVYQAAMTTYQTEIKTLKSNLDHVTNERDKLKSDLNSSNMRQNLFAKEVDERHSSMEKAQENKLQNVEKKYQEQIKNLQTEVETERELLTNQSSKQKQKLEREIEALKEEDIKHKETIAMQLKEMEKLEADLVDANGKVKELERVNFRQQRELESVEDLHRRIAEMESNRDLMQDEQQRFTQQKLQLLENDNKELRDKNDELTMELENVRQQISSHKKKSRGKSKEKLVRSGSYLSDYAKPTVVKRGPTSSTDEEEDDTSTAQRQRRRLPTKPKDSNDEDDLLITELEMLKREHEKELNQLKDSFEIEKREIEQAFKMEITAIEDNFNKEKTDLMQGFRKEKERVQDDFEIERSELRYQIQKELEEKFEQRKREMVVRHESEKNLLESQFAEDKAKITQRLREEYNEDLELRLLEMRERFQREKDELETELTKDRSDYKQLSRQKADMELKMKLLKEELELQFNKERAALREKYLQERRDLEEKHRMDIFDYENMFVQGESALKGKLKDDFYAMLSNQKDEWKQKERDRLAEKLEKEKEELAEAFELEKASISQAYTTERSMIEENYKQQIDELQDELQRERERFLRERDNMEGKMTDEMRQEMEDEFASQIERIQNAFYDERDEYENRIHLLEDEVEDLRSHRDNVEQYLRKVEELKRLNMMLEAAKALVDQENEELIHRIDDLTYELSTTQKKLEEKIVIFTEEKEIAVQEAREEILQTISKKDSQHQAAFEAFNKQKQVLEDRLKKVQEELNNARNEAQNNMVPKSTHEVLAKHKTTLEDKLESVQRQLADAQHEAQTNAILKEDHEAIIQQKDELHDKVRELQHDLTNAQNQAKNYEVEKAARETLGKQKDVLEENVKTLREQLSMAQKEAISNKIEKTTHEALTKQKDELEEHVRKLRQDLNNAQNEAKNNAIEKASYDQILTDNLALQQRTWDLQHQLDQSRIQLLEADRFKDEQATWEHEKNLLKVQLQDANDKLMEATSALTLAQSKHQREILELRDNIGMRVDRTIHNNLNLKLVESEKKVRELEEALETRAAESNKTLLDSHDNHRQSIQKLEDERDHLVRQLNETKGLLNTQVGTLRNQYEKSSRSDLLVKELYIENSQLMKALQITEERQKKAERTKNKLEDKCKALQLLLNKICPAALG